MGIYTERQPDTWTNITADRPTCRWCIWVWSCRDNCFRLKYIHQICEEHRRAA